MSTNFVVPFPVPAHGYALNSKMRVNLEAIVQKLNDFNSGNFTWDNVALGITGTLTFANSTNSFLVTLKAGITSANITFTLPIAEPTASNQFLTADTSGNLSFDSTMSIASGQLLITRATSAGSGYSIRLNNTTATAGGSIRIDNNGTPTAFFGTTAAINGGTDLDPCIVGDSGRGIKFFTNGSATAALSITTTNQTQFSDGSVSAPSISFIGDTTTGLSRTSSILHFSVGGTEIFELQSTNIAVMTGNFQPEADNTRSNGVASRRWSDLYAVNVHAGDIHMENNWAITEGDKVGYPDEGIMFVSPTGKKYKISMTEVA